MNACSLLGNCTICGQSEVTGNVGQTSTSEPQRCTRQHGVQWTGRSDHLDLPDCQLIYTQDGNLHQNSSAPMTRGCWEEVGSLWSYHEQSNIDSDDLLPSFPREAFPEEKTLSLFSPLPAVTLSTRGETLMISTQMVAETLPLFSYNKTCFFLLLLFFTENIMHHVKMTSYSYILPILWNSSCLLRMLKMHNNKSARKKLRRYEKF